MNSVKMNEILFAMARESSFSIDICAGVITSINSIYMQSTNFYEKDAINVFNNFVTNGVLNFADYNIKF